LFKNTEGQRQNVQLGTCIRWNLQYKETRFSLIEYTKNAKNTGIEVIIATARGAAHLPGMIASFTILLVIAVPLRTSFLDGLDSVLSMLQMPSGVPVATVSVNSARNAAILACQIISLHNENIRHKLDKLKIRLATEVEEQAEKVNSKSSSIIQGT
jgi:5-(carboxyamino)imidazole ribonucleotide mutase